MWIESIPGAPETLSASGATRSHAARCERKPECRDPHPRSSALSAGRNCCWERVGGRPVFPGPERVVRVGGRVMRARCSGRRRKRWRRDSRRNSPSSGVRPVSHADRIDEMGHPWLTASEPAGEWIVRSSCDVPVVERTVNASVSQKTGRGINSVRGVLHRCTPLPPCPFCQP